MNFCLKQHLERAVWWFSNWTFSSGRRNVVTGLNLLLTMSKQSSLWQMLFCSVQVWNLTNCKLKTNHYGHTGYVNTVTVSPDGSLCASGGKVRRNCFKPVCPPAQGWIFLRCHRQLAFIEYYSEQAYCWSYPVSYGCRVWNYAYAYIFISSGTWQGWATHTIRYDRLFALETRTY